MQKIVKTSRTSAGVVALITLVILTIMIHTVHKEKQLTLLGNNPMELSLDEEYQEPGILYGKENVTNQVECHHAIDNHQEGVYEITYLYQNAKGRVLTIRRLVEVVAR